MAIDVSGLEAAAAAQDGVADSLLAFVTALKAQLATELANDPAAQAVVNTAMEKILANNARFASAVEAPATP